MALGFVAVIRAADFDAYWIRSKCVGFLGFVFHRVYIICATDKTTMSAPDKNGNCAKCAPSSAGTSSEEQARSKVSARELQGRSKDPARM
jgi:hypothetical protein